jgi:hypothetical protein
MASHTPTNCLRLDLECIRNPYVDRAEVLFAAEMQKCISIQPNWGTNKWIGLAFLSGPDSPAWWGDTTCGCCYDLSGLKKRRLVFYGRAEPKEVVIEVQVGILGAKLFGDSLKESARTNHIRLTREWARHEFNLSNVPPERLSRICSGFVITLTNAPEWQDVTVYLDSIYFE